MIVNSRSTDGNGGFGEGRWLRKLGSLVRRKQVDSAHVRREGHQLARKLSAVDLVGIGNLIRTLSFVIAYFILYSPRRNNEMKDHTPKKKSYSLNNCRNQVGTASYDNVHHSRSCLCVFCVYPFFPINGNALFLLHVDFDMNLLPE